MTNPNVGPTSLNDFSEGDQNANFRPDEVLATSLNIQCCITLEHRVYLKDKHCPEIEFNEPRSASTGLRLRHLVLTTCSLTLTMFLRFVVLNSQQRKSIFRDERLYFALVRHSII